MKIGIKIVIAIITAFLIILSAMLYLTFMANSSAAETSSNPFMRIPISVAAGHGGDDGGARGIA